MNRRTLNRGSIPMLLAALAGGVGLTGQSARGQTLGWANAAGGSAGTAGNWNPAQVPGAAAILNFGLAGAYSVSFPASVPASAQQNFNAGTISLSMLTPHTASTQFVVGLTAGSTPSVTLTSGTLTSPAVSVAANSTSTAVLTITGPTADVVATGAGGTRIGNLGNGTLTIANGGSLRSTSFVSIGSAAGSRGAVTVTGFNGASASELVTLNSATGHLNIGLGGPGTLAVSTGGLVDIAGSVFVAPTAGVTGSAIIGQGRIDVAGDLHVGHNATAAASGTGTFTANAASITNVAGEIVVGDSAGGTGTLVVNQGANMLARSLTVDSAHGVLNLNGGAIRLTDGVFTAPNNQLVLNGSGGAEPTLSLSNSSCTLSAAAPGRAIVLGTTGRAFLDLLHSSRVNVQAGDIVLGDGAGSTGDLQIQLAATLTQANTGMFTVGNDGSGGIVFGAGGHLSVGSMQVGSGAFGVGSVSIRTPTSTLELAGTLALGGTMAAAGGAGSMTIENGGSVTVEGGLVHIPVKVWDGGGSLTINQGGTLTTSGVVLVPGDFTLAGGVVNADNVVLQGARSYAVAGTIHGGFQPGPPSVVNLTGPLGVEFLLNDGTINVGDQALTILPPGGTVNIGNAALGALGRVASLVPLTLGSGKVLSGDGVIDAAITNLGTITGAGGALTLNGIVTGVGEGIGGVRIEFGPQGGFVGGGSFGETTLVSAEAGSVIRATDDLAMGSAGTRDAFVSRGLIQAVGNAEVLLRTATPALARDIAFVDDVPSNPPEVRSTRGIVVDGVVTGTGMISSSVSSSCRLTEATLVPGGAGAAGSLYFIGDTVLGASSRTEIDIMDATTHDKIYTLASIVLVPTIHTVPSDIVLGGTLVLRVAEGHVPSSGETHQIVDVVQGLLGPDGFVNGGFDTIEAPRHWLINVVRSSGVNRPNGVFAVYCTADFNEDGFVDFFDYDNFVECFESGVCPLDTTADFNGDGFADFFDYDDFVLAFENGC